MDIFVKLNSVMRLMI